MVAVQRLESETAEQKQERAHVENHAHWTEVVQKARQELESGQVSAEELEASVSALRFRPLRIEYMRGGPGRWIVLR